MQEPRRLSVGDISFLYEPGLIRRLTVADTELVRMISAPVRDENWATLAPTLTSSEVQTGADRVQITERFHVGNGALDALLSFDLRCDSGGANATITANLTLTGVEAMQTNRAGFTLLHPIAGTTGTPLQVTHSDGRLEDTRFPEHISPGQPAIDICRLEHWLSDIDVAISFEGEVFETEDQRNWSDASFKTYCRPLSLPFPYTIAEGQTITQRIVIELNHKPQGNSHHVAATPEPMIEEPVRLPQIGLALEPEWLPGAATVPLPRPPAPVMRFVGASSWSHEKLAQIASSYDDVDIEIVIPEAERASSVCEAIKERLEKHGLAAKHVTALPQAYLKSYQPKGPWPEGLSPEACARVARVVFNGARIGVGMLTNFTEFNRRPPDISVGDFITFANTAIVHAADDLSVWETLEALPHIFQSAQALANGLPMRLGLFSVGMRSNPYGSAMAPNPNASRTAMTGEDPRQITQFAAAYAVAAFALAAEAGVEAITLAAPTGRLGMMQEGGELLPIGQALAAVSALGPHATLMRDETGIKLTSAAGSVSAVTGGQGSVHLTGFGGLSG